ncbi:hypothetical protein ACFZAT_30340 [Streptomyces sp. NPDC008163]|uniref:hypothetical protein n=1 Tax=Streptomyces sp. NPDC008163 TaxID=3364818 RepID=UPI0036E100A5
MARTLEDVLFTPIPPAIGPVRLTTSYVSASRATRLGGDLYDVEPCSVRERVTPLLTTGDTEDALHRVREDVAGYTGGPPDDDSALLLVEFRGSD